MAEEKKEGAWVKIVLALIAGGATVLAATLPLYLSSQKRADTADSESGTLRRQVESLQSTVKAKDTQIAELHDQARRSAAGSSTHAEAVPPPSPAGGPIHEAVAEEIKFQLSGCTPSGFKVTCSFLVTNLGVDRDFQFDSGRIIDSDGNEYAANYFSLGAKRNQFFVSSSLLSGVTVKGSFEFEAVRTHTRLIKVLELKGHTLDAARSQVAARLTEITL